MFKKKRDKLERAAEQRGIEKGLQQAEAYFNSEKSKIKGMIYRFAELSEMANDELMEMHNNFAVDIGEDNQAWLFTEICYACGSDVKPVRLTDLHTAHALSALFTTLGLNPGYTYCDECRRDMI